MTLDCGIGGKLFPEVHLESVVKDIPVGDTQINEYSTFSPYIISLRELAATRNLDLEIRLNRDHASEFIKSNAGARYDYGMSEKLDAVAKGSMILSATSVGAVTQTNQRFRYAIWVTKPTTYEKIKYKLGLDEEDIRLDEKYEISKKIASGIMRSLGSTELNQKFDYVKEVAKKVTIAANGEAQIGPTIHPPDGKKAVLLSVTTEVAGTPNQVYVYVNRDKDPNIDQLDCYAMPGVAEEQACYIPCIDEMTVRTVTGINVTNFRVRYTYGVSKITILDKKRWRLPLSPEEEAIADQYDLDDVVVAGVL